MPFSCEHCGRWTELELIPAVGDVLQCRHCAGERAFFKPPLLIVTGTSGIGKSTLCARLAGTIPGTILLDADIHAEDLVSVVPPNHDYPAFWRSMMRLAHELAQNSVVVVYFSTMLPEQVLANSDVLAYFDSVHFLCLTCPREVLRRRHAHRVGGGFIARTAVRARSQRWIAFNDALSAAASGIPTAKRIDAGRTIDEVEEDVRRWIETRLPLAGPAA